MMRGKGPLTSSAASELYLGATPIRASLFRELLGARALAIDHRRGESVRTPLRVLVAGGLHPPIFADSAVDVTPMASGSLLCEELAELDLGTIVGYDPDTESVGRAEASRDRRFSGRRRAAGLSYTSSLDALPQTRQQQAQMGGGGGEEEGRSTHFDYVIDVGMLEAKLWRGGSSLHLARVYLDLVHRLLQKGPDTTATDAGSKSNSSSSSGGGGGSGRRHGKFIFITSLSPNEVKDLFSGHGSGNTTTTSTGTAPTSSIDDVSCWNMDSMHMVSYVAEGSAAAYAESENSSAEGYRYYCIECLDGPGPSSRPTPASPSSPSKNATPRRRDSNSKSSGGSKSSSAAGSSAAVDVAAEMERLRREMREAVEQVEASKRRVQDILADRDGRKSEYSAATERVDKLKTTMESAWGDVVEGAIKGGGDLGDSSLNSTSGSSESSSSKVDGSRQSRPMKVEEPPRVVPTSVPAALLIPPAVPAADPSSIDMDLMDVPLLSGSIGETPSSACPVYRHGGGHGPYSKINVRYRLRASDGDVTSDDVARIWDEDDFVALECVCGVSGASDRCMYMEDAGSQQQPYECFEYTERPQPIVLPDDSRCFEGCVSLDVPSYAGAFRVKYVRKRIEMNSSHNPTVNSASEAETHSGDKESAEHVMASTDVLSPSSAAALGTGSSQVVRTERTLCEGPVLVVEASVNVGHPDARAAASKGQPRPLRRRGAGPITSSLQCGGVVKEMSDDVHQFTCDRIRVRAPDIGEDGSDHADLSFAIASSLPASSAVVSRVMGWIVLSINSGEESGGSNMSSTSSSSSTSGSRLRCIVEADVVTFSTAREESDGAIGEHKMQYPWKIKTPYFVVDIPEHFSYTGWDENLVTVSIAPVDNDWRMISSCIGVSPDGREIHIEFRLSACTLLNATDVFTQPGNGAGAPSRWKCGFCDRPVPAAASTPIPNTSSLSSAKDTYSLGEFLAPRKTAIFALLDRSSASRAMPSDRSLVCGWCNCVLGEYIGVSDGEEARGDYVQLFPHAVLPLKVDVAGTCKEDVFSVLSRGLIYHFGGSAQPVELRVADDAESKIPSIIITRAGPLECLVPLGSMGDASRRSATAMSVIARYSDVRRPGASDAAGAGSAVALLLSYSDFRAFEQRLKAVATVDGALFKLYLEF